MVLRFELSIGEDINNEIRENRYDRQADAGS